MYILIEQKMPPSGLLGDLGGRVTLPVAADTDREQEERNFQTLKSWRVSLVGALKKNGVTI